MQMYRKYISLVAVLIVVLLPLQAKHFKVLDISNGLPNNTVKCISQDKDGFIWMGTFDGLCRFDGVDFTVFRHNSKDSLSISDNYVPVILPQNDGIWVGTGNGLDFYSFKDHKFHPCYKLNGKEKVLLGTVRNIIACNAGLFVLSSSGELLVLKNEYTFMSCDGQFSNGWLMVGKYKDDYILAHNNNGLYILDPQKQQIISRLEYTVTSPVDFIYHSARKDIIYVGHGIGYPGKSFKVEGSNIHMLDAKLPRDIKSIIEYDNCTLFGTDGNGLCQLLGEKSGYTTTGNSNLSNDAIHSLFVDKEDNLWIGTYRGGVNMYNKRNDWFSSLTVENHNLSYNLATAIFQSEDQLYVGLDGGGLNVYNLHTGKLSVYTTANSTIGGNNILSITGDQHHIWLGVFGVGLVRFTPSNKIFKLFQIPPGIHGQESANQTWVVKDDNNGGLWVGSRSGLYKFDKKEENFTIQQEQIQYISEIAFDEEKIWVSTSNGLYKLDLLGNIIKHYHRDNKNMPLANNFVRYVYVDTQAQVWFATEYSGLNKLDEQNGAITTYGQQHGLSNPNIVGIVEDRNGYLWVSTYNGLFRFDPHKGKFIHFGKEDNLTSSQFNYNACYQNDSTMYFGTVKGVIRFNPLQVKYNSSFKQVYFTGFELLNEAGFDERFKTSPTKIHLPYNQNFFTIHFSIPEMNSPEKIFFSGYLKNFEKDWQNIGHSRKVSYTNVPPGEYTLCVRSTNYEGEWNEDFSRLTIIISPPWWKTIFARIIWVILLMALLLLILWFYKHELSIKHQIKLKEIEKNATKTINEAKLGFYTNITHELRNPIFLITAPLEGLINNRKGIIPVPRSQLITIYRNSMRLSKLIDRIIDFRKLESGKLKLNLQYSNVVSFCKELTLDYDALCSQKNIIFHYLPSKTDIWLAFDAEKLETVLSNLITNAFKYTPEGGRIQLSIDETGDYVAFAVEDNGIGIKKKYHESIFDQFFQVNNDNPSKVGDGIGLSFVKSLIGLHSGTIAVESEPGKGSKFIFRLPQTQPIEDNMTQQPFIPDEKHLTSSTVSQITHNPLAPHTLLIIDDEKETVDTMERLLSKDYKILKSSNGVDGLAMARESFPDIIICDIMMPKMNGIEFVAAIRNDKQLSQVPIIMYTAKTNEEDMLAAFDCGANAYLTKPVSVRYLKKRIEILLAQSESVNIASFTSNATINYTKEEKRFLLKCKIIIDDNLTNEHFDVTLFSQELGMSHSSFYKKIKKLTGKSVIDFTNEYRIYKAVQFFNEGETNINTVCSMCGFNDPKNFREIFKRKMNMTPTEYIQQI